MTWCCAPTPGETRASVTSGRETRRLHVCVVILLLAGWLIGLAATVDILLTEDPVVLQPPTGEELQYFGFSLTHYVDGSHKWLLVGAPLVNARIGGLYKCLLSKTDGDHTCQKVPITFSDDVYPTWAKSNNSDQRLGFSLASDGKAIVVCAPQWFASKIKTGLHYLPAGMCFAAESLGHEFKAFTPPFDDYSQRDGYLSMSYLNSGSCLFGLSATYLKGQSNTFAFGAPGCWNLHGDTWEVQLDSESSDTLQFSNSRLSVPRYESKTHYMGYSVTSLKFGDKNTIVSSIPRSTTMKNFKPTIVILTQDLTDGKSLTVHHNISSSKAGSDEFSFSFFGYSLATLDMNGDGMEDLAVGAPFYRNDLKGNDLGAVFVYIQTVENHPTKGNIFQMKEEDNAPQRMGRQAFSRLGSCVAAIGDLDGDGYEDLAVGAPFMTVNSDQPFGTGEVHIYMGSKEGLEKTPFQIIKAGKNQLGFGSSIAQLLPSIEGQGYDVAVGVYNSDKVLIYKSKEVIDVSWNLTFNKRIDLTQNTCICQIYNLCPCTTATTCLKYRRIIAKNENNVKIGFNIYLNATDDEIFFETGGKELQLAIEVEDDAIMCEHFTILAKPGIQEIKSFTIKGHMSLSQEEEKVILARNSTLTKREQLAIVIHCDAGDIKDCQSDIILEYDILDNYILMSNEPMKIHFKVINQGEKAYASRLIIQSNDIFSIDDTEGSEITCDPIDNKEIECSIGSLNNKSEVSFNTSLLPSENFFASLDTHASVFNILAEVKTLSALSHPETAIKEIRVDIIVEGSLQLSTPPSEPKVVYFNSSSEYKLPSEAKSEEELGPQIKHAYKISNDNKFSIYKAELSILLPDSIDGKKFLYLLEKISFSSSGQTTMDCQYPSDLVDPFNLTTNTRTHEGQDIMEADSPLRMEIGDVDPKNKNITCSLGEISANEEITLSLRSRLVLRTLAQLEVGGGVKEVSSHLRLWVTRMPLNYTLPQPSQASVTTTISYQKESPETTVPVWLYIVSVLAGLLLLGIIAIIMWKCGFFERRRVEAPDNASENQGEPLNKDEEEGEEEEDEAEVRTPTTPMLKETESANKDFEFHMSSKLTHDGR